MTCPHESASSAHTIVCDCLRTAGFVKVAGPSNPNYPCNVCRSEWRNDTPPNPADRSTWTPMLLAFVEPFNAEPLPGFEAFLDDFESAASTWRERGHLIADEATFSARVAICMGDESRPACRHWLQGKRRCRS